MRDRLEFPPDLVPYYLDEEGQIALFHGDCRDIIPRLPRGLVDAVYTDPPYGMDYCTGIRKPTHPGGLSERNRRLRDLLLAPIAGDGSDEVGELLMDTVAAVADIIAPNAPSYWFCSPVKIHYFVPILSEFFSLKNVMVWDKTNGTAGDLTGAYSKAWEAVLFMVRGQVPIVGKREQDIIRISKGSTSNYLHPTQKPVPLLAHLIGKHSSQVILDPFVGSGTTLIAARMLGRMAIGIEVNELHCGTTIERLRQKTLFSLDAPVRESQPEQAALL